MEMDAPGPDVKHHMVTVTPENSIAQSSLQEHVSSGHEVTPKLVQFQCSECFANKQLTKVFSKQSLLNCHIRQSHGERRFKCKVCFKAFHKSDTLKRHMRTHTVSLEKHMKCDLCPKTCGTKQALQNHLFVSHKMQTEGRKYFKCEFCSQEFVCKATLECHVVDEHVVDKEFPCPICSKAFIDPETLKKHMARYGKKETFVCDVCSKEYQYMESLKNHLKLQHAKSFYCYKCGRSFSSKREFDEHINLHSKTVAQFKCDICLGIFHSQCNLDIHTNSHLKEIIINKKEHEMKSAPNKHQIDDNVKTTLPKSTQELYTCDLCLQSFDLESHFRLHRTRVHPNAMWKCNFEQCSKSFAKYSRLLRHKATHSACIGSICPKLLMSSKGMETYEGNKHGAEVPSPGSITTG